MLNLLFLLPLALAESTTTTVNSLQEVYATEYIWTNLARELTSTILYGLTVIAPLESAQPTDSSYYSDVTATATELLTLSTNGTATVETTVVTTVCTKCAAPSTAVTNSLGVNGTMLTAISNIPKPTTDIETSTQIGNTDNISTQTVGDTTTVVEDCPKCSAHPTSATVNVISEKADTSNTIETVTPTISTVSHTTVEAESNTVETVSHATVEAESNTVETVSLATVEAESITINTQAAQSTTITLETVAAPTVSLSIYEGNAPKVAIGMTGVLGLLALML